MRMRRTTLRALTLAAGFAVASATIAAAAGAPHTNTAVNGTSRAAAQFFVAPPCTAGDSHVLFSPHRNPFEGGGSGMYGDVFFAGGAGNRLQPPSSSAMTQASSGSSVASANPPTASASPSSPRTSPAAPSAQGPASSATASLAAGGASSAQMV